MVRPSPYGLSGAVPRRLAEQLAAQRDEARAQAQRLATEQHQLQAQLRAAQEDGQQLADELRSERARANVLEERLQRRPAESDDTERVQRLSADLANLRRRQQDAIDTQVRQQRATLLEELFGLRDTLERSLTQSADPKSPWHQGTLALRSQLDQSLRRLGVERIGEAGEPFDPRRHEAIGVAPGPVDTVLQVERHGFSDPTGTVLRPALVVVGRQ